MFEKSFPSFLPRKINREGDRGAAQLVAHPIDHIHPVRVWEREWAQKDRVDDGEDGSVRANAETKRENCNCRKAGVLHEHAHGIAKVSGKTLDIVHSAHVSTLLLELFQTAQLAPGRITGLIPRYALCDLLLNQFFQVKAEFVTQFLLDSVLAEE